MKLTQSGFTARLLALVTILLLAPLSQAQEFNWAPQFPVGASSAEISAPDQNGSTKTFSDLVGETGLLIMFSRSFDW